MEFTKGKIVEQVVWKAGLNSGGADVVTGVINNNNISSGSSKSNTLTSIESGSSGAIISGGPAPFRPLYEQLASQRARAEEEALRTARPLHNAPAGLDEDEIRFLEEQHELRTEQEEQEKKLDMLAKEEFETAAMFSSAAATAAVSLSEGAHERQREEERRRLVDAAAKSAALIATTTATGGGGGGGRKRNPVEGELPSSSLASGNQVVRSTASFKSLVVKKVESKDDAVIHGSTTTQRVAAVAGSNNKRDRVDTSAEDDDSNVSGRLVNGNGDASNNYDRPKKTIKVGEGHNEKVDEDVEDSVGSLHRKPPVPTALSVVKLPPPPFLKKQKDEKVLSSTTSSSSSSSSFKLVDYDDDEDE
jgi:hypothetical protein